MSPVSCLLAGAAGCRGQRSLPTHQPSPPEFHTKRQPETGFQVYIMMCIQIQANKTKFGHGFHQNNRGGWAPHCPSPDQLPNRCRRRCRSLLLALCTLGSLCPPLRLPLGFLCLIFQHLLVLLGIAAGGREGCLVDISSESELSLQPRHSTAACRSRAAAAPPFPTAAITTTTNNKHNGQPPAYLAVCCDGQAHGAQQARLQLLLGGQPAAPHLERCLLLAAGGLEGVEMEVGG